ncbi:MAG TPA: FtsX-like permease family protein [Frateuria sp.]|uniref:ABC transporter permease n=1 Tax=Frateuria sp. TaxID=2211372 RepID=UPI002DEEBE15|nr:FtsX-like permease family protein [Frateuria sp.]
MLRYYLDLALRSCRRSRALTMLVVMLMGFGVAACTLSYAVLRVAAKDPIPAKSSRLFVPQIDSLGPVHNGNGQPPDQLGYTDAMALLHAGRAFRQTLLYPTNFGVVPADPARQPFPQVGEAVTGDFFAMFDVPFRYGHGWDAAADQKRAPVAVITDALNRKLFGDIDSTGRTLTLDGHDYRISGVLGDFDPLPRYIDIASTWNGFGKLAQIYVPFARAVDQHKPPLTDYCSSTSAAPYMSDWNSFLSGCVWIDGWVELPDAASAAGYQRFLVNYATEQQRLGRFAWPANVRLPNLMQMLTDHRAVPRESKLSAWVSLGFLIVCLVNVVGLLLARFSRRGLEIGVRRALGAPRREIVRQFLVEAAVIGTAGGALGVLLTALGMMGLDRVFVPEIARAARLDGALMSLTLLAAVAATLAAALWPTWRIAQVRPAWQLAQG